MIKAFGHLYGQLVWYGQGGTFDVTLFTHKQILICMNFNRKKIDLGNSSKAAQATPQKMISV